MRIGVIGAHGFIGSQLTAALIAAGHEPVPFTIENPVTSEQGLRMAKNLDGLLWAASSSTPATVGQALDECDVFRSSLLLLQDSGIKRFLFMSSGGTVYGNGPAPHGEEDELKPVSDYGKLKAAMEGVARDLWPSATILRPSNVYGPGQLAKGGQGVLGHWLQAIVDGEPPILYGDPAVARDYVYIDDCVRAIIAAFERDDAAGQTINIGSGSPTSLDELLQIVCRVTGRRIDPRYEKGRPYDNQSTWLRIDRARDILGWTPETDLDDGIAAMWAWKEGR
ncbi:NAD-dependent epimerase/dehydratase family protein [Flaviflexus equikiangi]|uniref:NAD-dependent epimerase/dehydratase family protein n=1 Tax=Flaviflexus equikiangi TaxID=2758573 RepID=UPI0015F68434|nr:NAD-dependent epimerase/dehydratase family protein [Flaviflexus equikiangi]